MPSASSKPDKQAPVGVEDPLKQAIGIIEKKVRNLEKRKGKLDGYRQKKKCGEQLNQDQEEAIAAYDVVERNLIFAREISKQFAQLDQDVEKLARKQAKRERLERQAVEVQRCRQIFILQNTLDSMGSEEVREDFLKGTNGAVTLTEQNLEQLDELYKLISPSRDGENSFEEELQAASEHLAAYLEPRDKEVLGTTYKDLRDMIESIHNCGYFDQERREEAVEEEEVEEQTAPVDEVPQDAEFTGEIVPESTELLELEEPILETPEITSNRVSEIPEPIPEPVMETQPEPTSLVESQPVYHEETSAASYYGTTPYQRPRDFSEIVSSVKGTFTFIQDSHIDDNSPHMDPAVVAAQPMGSSLTPQPEPSNTLTFQSTSYLTEESLAQRPAAQTAKPTQDVHKSQPAAQSQLPVQTQPPVHVNQSSPSPLDSYSPSQSYSQQSYMAATQPAGTFPDQSTAPLAQTMPHAAVMEAAVMAGNNPPAAIPMPNQSAMTPGNDMSQETLDIQEKKPFTMNPNAALFQPMFDQTSGTMGPDPQQQQQPPQQQQQQQQQMGSMQSGHVGQQDPGFPQDEASKALGQQMEQGDYQGFGNYRNNQNRGGRSGRGRGGGGSGMPNGFQQNQRGGGGGRNGNYNNQRGMYNNRGGNRGGSYNNSFQGYPPRQDYRPDSYQGFSNGGFNSNNQRARGGKGAPRGGPPRGGQQQRGGQRPPYSGPRQQSQQQSMQAM